MNLGLRIRLSAMMFLEFFAWGAWYPVLNVFMKGAATEGGGGGMGLGEGEIGMVYSLLPLASIFMPMIAGQITDRLVPTQIFLGLAHLIGGAGALYAAFASAADYPALRNGILVWALCYAPTISLTNSLAFAHLRDAEREFGLIRVFGTIGWIAAGWSLSAWRYSESLKIGGDDCLYLAGAAGIAMGIFCFTLPHTPPARSGVSPWAVLKAFELMKDPRIAVFLVISFVVGTELPFFFQLTPNFLTDLGVQDKNIPTLMSIGQVAEILTMLALPWFLKRFGPRKTLFFGILAWPVRYLIFSLGQPFWLVAASLALHGFCFVFFFVVAFIYIDSVAPKDIKASAQGLLTLMIYGFGMWLGSLFAGEVAEFFSDETTKAVNWTRVFLVPSAITIACALILMVTFPKGSMREAAAAQEEAA